MSEQSLDVVRRVFAEFQAGLSTGNPAAAYDAGMVAADAEWVLPTEAPGLLPSYKGRDGFLDFIRTWTEDFDWAIELDRMVDAGDGRVVVITRQRATGRGSGVPVELHTGGLWTVKKGQVTRMETYFDTAEAFAAAGISE